jgi:hypothetical protein
MLESVSTGRKSLTGLTATEVVTLDKQGQGKEEQ